MLARRFAGVGAALLLCPFAGPAAADPTPAPSPTATTMNVECPSADDVAAALGRPTSSTLSTARECQYSASGAGVVLFGFEPSTLAELRSAAESAGAPLTEVDDLGQGAFATRVGNSWVLNFQAGAEAAALVVPAVLQSGAVTLAERLLAASSPLPGATPSPEPDDYYHPGMPSSGD